MTHMILADAGLHNPSAGSHHNRKRKRHAFDRTAHALKVKDRRMGLRSAIEEAEVEQEQDWQEFIDMMHDYDLDVQELLAYEGREEAAYYASLDKEAYERATREELTWWEF